MAEENKDMTRRDLLKTGLRAGCAVGLVGTVAYLARRALGGGTVWQLDPYKCMQCGKCATACVLEESATKCIHAFAMCGYCDFCTGFFEPQPNQQNAGAENLLCPTGALQRTYVKNPYYQYTIDEKLCIGCGRCVRGCADHGNGSLFLQVRHDRCLNCNECSIAKTCPADAFRRVPASEPYIIKTREHKA